jgi:hypothetical protein
VAVNEEDLVAQDASTIFMMLTSWRVTAVCFHQAGTSLLIVIAYACTMLSIISGTFANAFSFSFCDNHDGRILAFSVYIQGYQRKEVL